MASHNGQKCSRIFIESRFFFFESRFFFSSRENFFLKSRIFFRSQNFFMESRIIIIQDCISYIERCTAPRNDRNMECKHDRLEGFVEIIAAFSLVLANVQGFLEIKVLVDDLPHFLRELLNHIRHKNTASFQVSAEFRSVPYRERSSLGRPKYNITAERIDVLRSTGMQ